MREDQRQPSAEAVHPSAWSPTGIALLSLILTPVAGGVLYGLNERKLGRVRTWRLALLASVIAALLIDALQIATDDRPVGLGLSAHLLFAAYFYKAQADLFARHLQAGGRKASLVPPVILTLVVAVVLLGVKVVLSGG